MQNSNSTKMRVVRLMDPAMCLSCKFASIATVEMDSGKTRRMLHCRRLDCDNWQSETDSEQPRQVYDNEVYT